MKEANIDLKQKNIDLVNQFRVMKEEKIVLENQIKLGNSLISELRIGFELLANFWTEVGILTIDSSSGGGSGDQRLGSTGYLFGFSYGF